MYTGTIERRRERVLRSGHRVTTSLPDRFVDFFRNYRSGALLSAVLAAGFAALAILALWSEPTLLRFDRTVQGVLLGLRTDWLNQAMIWLTFLGTRYAIGAAMVGLMLWSLITRRHRTFVLVIGLAVLLNPVVEVGFKELIHRVRPTVAQLLPGNGPSFPSGHVLAAVGFYGLLPFLTWEATRSTLARWAALAGSLSVVAAVTVSRPYLDVHWATDAIAGVLLGTVLVTATYQAYLSLARRRIAGGAREERLAWTGENRRSPGWPSPV